MNPTTPDALSPFTSEDYAAPSPSSCHPKRMSQPVAGVRTICVHAPEKPGRPAAMTTKNRERTSLLDRDPVVAP